jgi:hypothetical protein
VGRLLGRAEKKKNTGGLGWVRVGCFVSFFSIPFLSFLFQTFTQNLFKNFKQTFDHTINSKSMHST